jgi:multidrug efflux pump subunit AcrA (membrane-fusion protein)
MERKRRIINLCLAVGFLAGGGGAYAWLVYTKPVPAKRLAADRVLEVAVLPVDAHLERTPVIGHGTVQPKHQINIIPQVSGRLTQVHADLAQGKVIPKGELLFEIEPTVYDARVRQAEAESRGLEAALERHDQELVNTDARIANAEAMLAIDEEDYRTSKELYEVEKVGTQRDVDMANQKYLRQKGAVVDLTSQRSMIPHVKLETQAQLDAARARLAQAQHDLENTKIVCPFEARVETVSAYKSQVVTAHFSIATLTDMEAFEISVGIDPRELRWLDGAIRPEALGKTAGEDSPTVKVQWSVHGTALSWEGRVTRFERVDEATRTARMVIEVRQVDMVATMASGSGESPPRLSIGMYCKTELPAEPLVDALMVPRHAIYDSRWVYVFEPDAGSAGCPGSEGTTGRLGQRTVPLLRSLGDSVLVDYRGRGDAQVCELAAGDRIIVSPLTKPVVGMKVRLRNEETSAGADAIGAKMDSRTSNVVAVTTLGRGHGGR